MNEIAKWMGYLFMLTCAWGALLWTWETFARNTWKRCIDSADFYRFVVEYAKQRKRRKDGRVGFSDE